MQAAAALGQAGQLLEKAATGAADSLPSTPLLTLAAAGEHLPAFPTDITVSEAVREFLMAKARAGRSDRYLGALRVSLKAFAKGRGHKPAREVTILDLETWLGSMEWSSRTQANYLSDVSVLYNWLKRRNLVRDNPALGVELPEPPQQPPRIHSPDQVRLALELARKTNPNLCRALAVRYFAGLRSSEVERIEEKEICPGSGYIEVTAAKAKTRQRRLVTVQPNLKAWLALGGKLPLHDVNNRWRWFSHALKLEHGIDWEHNVTRHSFVSYHLAAFGSAAKTALEAGHTEQMTFAAYRELVTPAAAKDYWAIVPAGS